MPTKIEGPDSKRTYDTAKFHIAGCDYSPTFLHFQYSSLKPEFLLLCLYFYAIAQLCGCKVSKIFNGLQKELRKEEKILFLYSSAFSMALLTKVNGKSMRRVMTSPNRVFYKYIVLACSSI